MPGPHDKIIANAAKLVLGPHGFRRKGKSRIWMMDHGWWVVVVEFQPSSWSKGSYLNVAAHWLWSVSGTGVLSFDYGGRVAGYVRYQSDEQFTPEVTDFAESAAREADVLEHMFHSIEKTADVLVQRVRAQLDMGAGHQGWGMYHAGVASGLVGRRQDAEDMFARVEHTPSSPTSILHPAAKLMMQLVAKPNEFKHEIGSQIERQRTAIRLPPWNATFP